MNESQFTPRIAVVGCGRWGINHVRTAYQLLGASKVIAVDSFPAARERVGQISPEIAVSSDLEPVLQDDSVSGVIIATPAETHFDVARQCLERGKHVLVEKPITLHTSEARELIGIAERCGRNLMVGHILLYHPAVVAMKRKIEEGTIGTLQYIYSNRLNLGAIRSEENILWSFAPHDISVIQYLVGASPLSIDSHGAQFVQNGIEDTTVTYLRYPGNIHAHIFVSWLHPFKEQRMVVVGDKGMLVFEDSAASDKLRFYPKGFERTANGIQKFEGNYTAVSFEDRQPLAEEHRHFYHCIQTNTPPLTDGRHALEVLTVLEQATQRLHP